MKPERIQLTTINKSRRRNARIVDGETRGSAMHPPSFIRKFLTRHPSAVSAVCFIDKLDTRIASERRQINAIYESLPACLSRYRFCLDVRSLRKTPRDTLFNYFSNGSYIYKSLITYRL